MPGQPKPPRRKISCCVDFLDMAFAVADLPLHPQRAGRVALAGSHHTQQGGLCRPLDHARPIGLDFIEGPRQLPRFNHFIPLLPNR